MILSELWEMGKDREAWHVESSSVQLLSPVWLFLSPWTAAHQASLSITKSQSLFKVESIELVMPSDQLILCCPLLLLRSIILSMGLFKWVTSFHQVAKVLEFQLQHQSFQWIFRTDWFPLKLTDYISLLSKGLSRVFSNTTVQKHQLFELFELRHSSFLYSPTLTSTGKTIALTRRTFVGKVMSLLFNMQSRLDVSFLPRSKCLLVSWLQFICSDVGAKKDKSSTVPTISPSICHEVMGPDAMILVFWMLSFKLTFSLSSYTFIKRLFSSSLLSAIRVVSSAYLRSFIFLPAIWFQLVLPPIQHFSWCTLHIS